MIISEVPQTFQNRPDAVLLGKHIIRVLNKSNSVVPSRDISSITIEGDLTEVEIAPILTGYNSLILSAMPPSILANGVQETTITSAGLMTFDYNIWKVANRFNTFVLSGSINDGTLVFSTNESGVYLFEFISGNNTGYVEVTAND